MQIKNGYKIIIVNNTPNKSIYEKEVLEEQGFIVYIAKTDQKVKVYLESKNPDLIIIDLEYMKTSGIQLCSTLKKYNKENDIPIICLSNEKTSEKVNKCFEVGFCDYITKPILKEEYIARINYHINNFYKIKNMNFAYKELNLFCSAVSHDLKDPANILNMLTNQLTELLNQENKEVEKISNLISKKSFQLVSIVDKLLEFSRTCNLKETKTLIDLDSIVLETFEELKALEKDREIQLNCEKLESIYGDEFLIRMVIKNVLSNAIKFTKLKSKAIITVSTMKDDEYTILNIEDNGVGFDMEYSKNLFKAFNRLHSKEEFEGSGIGLIIVDRIMKRHNGKVELVGEVDRGAKMSLFF